MARSTAPASRRAPVRSPVRSSMRSPLVRHGGLRAERAARLTPGCTACGSYRLTEISMTLTDGSHVRFRSCHVCEHRTWSDAEEDILPLSGVLTRARKPR